MGSSERRKEIRKRRLAALGDRRKRRGIEQALLARCVCCVCGGARRETRERGSSEARVGRRLDWARD